MNNIASLLQKLEPNWN